MKNFVSAIIVLICTASTVNAQSYTPSPEEELVISNIIFPGYNPTYVVKESKDKVIKKPTKEMYTTVAKGPDGKPMTINATPRIGDEVLEFNGVYWYNLSTKQLIAQQKAPAASERSKQPVGATKEPRQKGNGPTLGQGVQVLGGIYQAVTGRRIGGFGGGQDLGGLGNGPVGNQSGLQ